MESSVKLPYYAKASLLLVGAYFLFTILAKIEDIILPILYATILAILISPVINFLSRKGWSRLWAIICVLVVSILLLIATIILLVSQVNMFADALPGLALKFQAFLKEIVDWTSAYFRISKAAINLRISNATQELLSSSNAEIGSTLSSMGSVFATIFLTPVYIFMLLFYQPHIIKAVHEVFGEIYDVQVSEILIETKTIVQSYLVGLFFELIVVAVLNSIGLLLLGIEYALLLGVLGAFLNVIPYLGGLIAVTIYMIIALVTKSPEYVIYVAILYSVIQFVDNNYLVPKMVGSKVKLNALVSIIVVIAGAALWGIPGMFLAIPLLAIIKLILDRIEPLKPWGTLLGDTMPPIKLINLPVVIRPGGKK